jgi:hypothetical protein
LAKVLAQTIKKHMPESKIVVCLIEKDLPDIQDELDIFDEIVLAKDMGYLNFEQIIFKYSQYETAGFSKGQLFQYILKNYTTEDHVIYLDADTQVFGPFLEVEEALRSYSIVLTPHVLDPIQDSTYLFGEFALLKSGIFNTGCIAVKRSREAYDFLNWLCDRLNQYCYFDPVRGLFNEQKWFDLVPVFFDKVLNFKHPGYNVAYWNLFERNISKAKDNYKVNGIPLRFFHFSGLDYIKDTLYLINNETTAHGMIILDEYQRLIQENGHSELLKTRWSYDYFDAGSLVTSKLRNIYKNSHLAQSEMINPFSENKRVFRKYK